MEKSEIKEKLKALFLSAEEAPAVELATMALEDGTVLEAEAFEAGNAVFIVTDGERIPAPEGEHKLEDGRILVINEEGLIGELKEAGEEAPAEEEELSSEDLAKAVISLSERLQKLEDAQALSAQEADKAKAELAEANEAKEAVEAESKTLKAQIEDLNTKLSKQPAAKPNKGNDVNLSKGNTPFITKAVSGSIADNIQNSYSNFNK